MSLAVLKRKTLTNNPREAPNSGIAGGSPFGFSLNGTRRGNYTGRETNLAPGAMTGPTQIIGSSRANPTGPGIYGHPSSVGTNDPTVVKTTVMNTKGMLARKLRGIERIPPMAPVRAIVPEDCHGNPNACGCGMGEVIAPAPEYIPCSEKNWPNATCVGPLTQNWVKNPTVPNGNQSIYIERIVKINGNSRSKSGCNSTKSFNGIIGVLDMSGLEAISNIPQGCNTSGKLSQDVIDLLVNTKSIMPFDTLCNRSNREIPLHLRNCTQFTPNPGIESFQQTKTVTKVGTFSKPGINTVDYGTYINRRLKIINYLPPQLGCNKPQPDPNVIVSCSKTSYNNYWNNNITPNIQWPYNKFTNLNLTYFADGIGEINILFLPNKTFIFKSINLINYPNEFAEARGRYSIIAYNTVTFISEGGNQFAENTFGYGPGAEGTFIFESYEWGWAAEEPNPDFNEDMGWVSGGLDFKPNFVLMETPIFHGQPKQTNTTKGKIKHVDFNNNNF